MGDAFKTCMKCGKTMKEDNFYTYKDGTKTELCKSCLTMHIDNFNPDTFLWALEKLDVPYIEQEWNTLSIPKKPLGDEWYVSLWKIFIKNETKTMAGLQLG